MGNAMSSLLEPDAVVDVALYFDDIRNVSVESGERTFAYVRIDGQPDIPLIPGSGKPALLTVSRCAVAQIIFWKEKAGSSVPQMEMEVSLIGQVVIPMNTMYVAGHQSLNHAWFSIESLQENDARDLCKVFEKSKCDVAQKHHAPKACITIVQATDEIKNQVYHEKALAEEKGGRCGESYVQDLKQVDRTLYRTKTCTNSENSKEPDTIIERMGQKIEALVVEREEAKAENEHLRKQMEELHSHVSRMANERETKAEENKGTYERNARSMDWPHQRRFSEGAIGRMGLFNQRSRRPSQVSIERIYDPQMSSRRPSSVQTDWDTMMWQPQYNIPEEAASYYHQCYEDASSNFTKRNDDVRMDHMEHGCKDRSPCGVQASAHYPFSPPWEKDAEEEASYQSAYSRPGSPPSLSRNNSSLPCTPPSSPLFISPPAKVQQLGSSPMRNPQQVHKSQLLSLDCAAAVAAARRRVGNGRHPSIRAKTVSGEGHRYYSGHVCDTEAACMWPPDDEVTSPYFTHNPPGLEDDEDVYSGSSITNRSMMSMSPKRSSNVMSPKTQRTTATPHSNLPSSSSPVALLSIMPSDELTEKKEGNKIQGKEANNADGGDGGSSALPANGPVNGADGDGRVRVRGYFQCESIDKGDLAFSPDGIGFTPGLSPRSGVGVAPNFFRSHGFNNKKNAGSSTSPIRVSSRRPSTVGVGTPNVLEGGSLSWPLAGGSQLCRVNPQPRWDASSGSRRPSFAVEVEVCGGDEDSDESEGGALPGSMPIPKNIQTHVNRRGQRRPSFVGIRSSPTTPQGSGCGSRRPSQFLYDLHELQAGSRRPSSVQTDWDAMMWQPQYIIPAEMAHLYQQCYEDATNFMKRKEQESGPSYLDVGNSSSFPYPLSPHQCQPWGPPNQTSPISSRKNTIEGIEEEHPTSEYPKEDLDRQREKRQQPSHGDRQESGFNRGSDSLRESGMSGSPGASRRTTMGSEHASRPSLSGATNSRREGSFLSVGANSRRESARSWGTNSRRVSSGATNSRRESAWSRASSGKETAWSWASASRRVSAESGVLRYGGRAYGHEEMGNWGPESAWPPEGLPNPMPFSPMQLEFHELFNHKKKMEKKGASTPGSTEKKKRHSRKSKARKEDRESGSVESV